MYDDGTIEIFLKVLSDKFDIFLGRLNKVNRSNSMQLLSRLFQMEIQGYIILS